MKKLPLTFVCLLLFSQAFSQTPQPKQSPTELAEVVVDALEQLRTSLDAHSLEFSKAELEIATTRELSGGGGLSVWVLEATYDASKETAVKVNYELSGLLSAAEDETKAIAGIELLVNEKTIAALKSKSIKPEEKLMFSSIDIPINSDLDTIKQANSYETIYKEVAAFKKRRKDSYEKCKEIIVKAVEQAILDYLKIKEKFSTVCFDVTISFSISRTTEGGATIFKIVSAQGAIKNSWDHAITLSFGKCD